MPPTPSADPRDTRIREALALRRWALPALCGAAGSAPPVSAEGWSTFLRSERCALPLLALGEAALGTGAAQVRRRASVETQRILSAGAQLHALARQARAAGGSVVVLKGGVPLAEGRPGADLVDVDVLAAAPRAEALAEALGASGYAAHGRASAHRLPERAAPDAVQVEIHTGVPGIGAAEAFVERAVPCRLQGLLVPHPEDHLWHLLLHTVAQHTGRRGSLRELVVMADALGRCAPGDVAAAEARTAPRRDGPALRAQLALAGALQARRPPGADPFRQVAATVYTTTEYLGASRLSMALRSAVAETSYGLVAARDGTLPAAEAGDGPRRGGPAGWLARRAPRWALTPPALLLVRRAARAVAEAGEA